MDIRSIQLIAYTDLKSIRLKEILTTQAEDSHVKFKEYNFNHFPHIPVTQTDQPFSHPPLIAIISRTLLKFVTSTPYKEEFIQHITGYHPNILHIWIGELSEKEVRIYSSLLQSPKQIFRFIKQRDLRDLSLNKVIQLLFTPKPVPDTKPYCMQITHGRYLVNNQKPNTEPLALDSTTPSTSTLQTKMTEDSEIPKATKPKKKKGPKK